MAKRTQNNVVAKNETVLDTQLDVTLPMGENGNSLVPDDDMAAFLEGLNETAGALEGEIETIAAEEEANKPIEPEAPEAPAEDQAPAQAEAPIVTDPVEHVPGDFKAIVEAVSPEQRTEMVEAVNDEFASRLAYEESKPGMSSKMAPNLEASRKHMTSIAAAAILCAVDIDPSFVNRELSTGKRFNVYGLQKITDLLTGLSAGFFKNPHNRSVLLSMFAFRDAGIPFNGSAALGACSDKVKVDRAVAKHLVRHTVDAGTAPTQKSSTMNALEILGIVTSNKLRGDAEVFTLTDTPQTRRAHEVLCRAA